MSREKQIEEMAEMLEIIENARETYANDVTDHTENEYIREGLLNAGYRKQEWISVDERLPEPIKLVLCIWERQDDGWNYGFARYQRENVWYVSNEGMPNVTHWMPLPEAPKMKGGAE